MNASVFIAALTMVLAGMMVAGQAPVNAGLARIMGDPVLAACVSFGVGFVALTVASLARGTVPALGSLGDAPWWAWTGGLLGAFYVAAASWSIPKLGAVTTLGAVILGQLAGALVLDAIGAFGMPVHPISWSRIAAVLLVCAGVGFSRVT